MKNATIIIPTRNDADNLDACLDACLGQDGYSNEKYSILIVDDASTDNTQQIIEKYAKKYPAMVSQVRLEKRIGRTKSLNIGIAKCATPVFIEMNADCIPQKNWLRTIMDGFTSDKIAVSKTTSAEEGASSAYKTDIIKKLGMFDERFNEMGSGFRMDSDLMFKILDAGYEIKRVTGAGYEHRHPKPTTTKGKIKYAWSRVRVHRFDPLLFKNHPERTTKMLDIRFGFMRNPATDFKTATGLWYEGGKLELSSPQGIKIVDGKTPFHAALIVLLGIGYVVLLKFSRLYGSIKFRKLLI